MCIGPVDKFYDAVYSSNVQKESPPPLPQAKGIRLWSDWNVQIYKWAQRRLQNTNNINNNNNTFGYYILHTEDLISSDVNIRYDTIAKLAKWVHSNMIQEDLCCMAMLETEFLGSHDRTERQEVNNNQVQQRYGKWKNILLNNKALRDSVYQYGAEGLQVFGYEPTRSFLSTPGMSYKDHCQMIHIDQCKQKLSPIKSSPVSDTISSRITKTVTDNVPCTLDMGIDYKGNDLLAQELNSVGENNVDECCSLCRSYQGCHVFTYDKSNNMCYLKSNSSERIENESDKEKFISGKIQL